jgi:hypothetical protein
VFGGPLETGYHHVVDPGFAEIHEHGLLGLSRPTAHSLYEHLLSPWGGLVYWAPLFALAIGLVLPCAERSGQWNAANSLNLARSA